MNYGSIQKGLKAPLVRLLLPSRLSRFMLEEKGDESQPWSELAHVWSWLKRWIALAMVSSMYWSTLKAFYSFFEKEKIYFFKTEAWKQSSLIAAWLVSEANHYKGWFHRHRTHQTETDLCLWSFCLSACFVTICFAFIHFTRLFLSLVPLWGRKISAVWGRGSPRTGSPSDRVTDMDGIIGLKHRRRIFEVPGQIRVVQVCVQSQGHPCGLHFPPSVCRGKEKIFHSCCFSFFFFYSFPNLSVRASKPKSSQCVCVCACECVFVFVGECARELTLEWKIQQEKQCEYSLAACDSYSCTCQSQS